MTYELDINNRAFAAIKARTKRIEIRATESEPGSFNYGDIIPGDVIHFTSFDGDTLYVTVTDVNHYDSIEELLTLEGTRYTLSSTNDFAKGVESINSIKGYKKAIAENGVYAIHLTPVPVMAE